MAGWPRHMEVSLMDDVALDRALQGTVREGEAAGESLGELRYRKCVTEGMDYSVWADKVGVDRSSVHESVRRYAARHGLPLIVGVPPQSRPKTERNPKGAGRPRGSGTKHRPAGRVARFAREVGSTAQALMAWKPRTTDDVDEMRHLADCLRTIETQAREKRALIERALDES